MKRGLLVLAVVAGLAFAAVEHRHRILIHALSLAGPPALLEAGEEGPGVRWLDDYFTVEALDERTFAIGEPRYAQQVFNYLIVGETRALLFDAGPGLRDVRAVAESLTDRPITFLPSHFHYDHVGNEVRFERVALVDLPHLRERARDGRLRLTFEEHLGVAEGFDAPTFEVSEWIAPGSFIDLGGRSVQLLLTPGHTEESVSLLDAEAGRVFTGDFLYPGPLYAFLPNSGMGDYLQGAETVLRLAPAGASVHGAHRTAAPEKPVLGLADVEDLRAALVAIQRGALSGKGFYPVEYPVNDRIQLLAEPPSLQNWTPHHPE